MYTIIFNNGFWKIRNIAEFKDVAMYGTYKEAQASLDAEMRRLSGDSHA